MAEDCIIPLPPGAGPYPMDALVMQVDVMGLGGKSGPAGVMLGLIDDIFGIVSAELVGMPGEGCADNILGGVMELG